MPLVHAEQQPLIDIHDALQAAIAEREYCLGRPDVMENATEAEIRDQQAQMDRWTVLLDEIAPHIGETLQERDQ